MTHTYTIGRNMRGDLRALTIVGFGAARRELRIETSKGFNGLSCFASVVQISKDGCSYVHAVGYGTDGGDFSRTLERDAKMRCTEKNVRAMHERGIALIDGLLPSLATRYEVSDERALIAAVEKVAEVVVGGRMTFVDAKRLYADGVDEDKFDAAYAAR